MAEPTHDSEHDSATLCRLNGWGAGTVLEGDEGYGPTRILITAVGEQGVLARCLTRAHGSTYESSWTLRSRDWREVETEG